MTAFKSIFHALFLALFFLAPGKCSPRRTAPFFLTGNFVKIMNYQKFRTEPPSCLRAVIFGPILGDARDVAQDLEQI